VEVLRRGEWLHPRAPGGKLVVDDRMLREIVDNYKRGVMGRELPVNLNHADDSIDAAGWVVDLEQRGDSLFATVEIVDPRVKELVDSKRLRFASAELALNYLHPEHQKRMNVLRGIALTNRPYIKNMQDIAPLNLSEFASEEGETMEQEQTKNTVPHLLPPVRFNFRSRDAGESDGNADGANSALGLNLSEGETAVIELTEEEFSDLLARASRVEELEQELQHLLRMQREAAREAWLSEYADRVPPSVLQTARALVRALEGETITLSDLDHLRDDAQYVLALGENVSDDYQLQPVELVQILLNEIAATNQWTRQMARSQMGYEVPTRTTVITNDSQRLQLLQKRAEQIAQNENIPYSEAVKRAARELRISGLRRD
jgi:type II secretory pathway pseudopilin PulG